MSDQDDGKADDRRARFDDVIERSYLSAKKAADSLRRKKRVCTPYSIAKEAERLVASGVEGARKVSANTIRNNKKCASLLDEPGKRLVFHCANAPKDMKRMTRDEAIEQAKLDRELAEHNSSRLILAEIENARLKLEIRKLRQIV